MFTSSTSPQDDFNRFGTALTSEGGIKHALQDCLSGHPARPAILHHHPPSHFHSHSHHFQQRSKTGFMYMIIIEDSLGSPITPPSPPRCSNYNNAQNPPLLDCSESQNDADPDDQVLVSDEGLIHPPIIEENGLSFKGAIFMPNTFIM